MQTVKTEIIFSENEELRRQNAELLARCDQSQSQVKLHEEEVERLHEMLRDFKRQVFGKKKSERWESPEQVLLFNEVEQLAREAKARDGGGNDKDADDTIEVGAHTKKRGHRKSLPENLPREIVIVDVPESEWVDEHGVVLQVIGHEVSEKLEFTPATLKVLEFHRLKYGYGPGDYVKTAPPPPSMIPKGIATSSLLAHIVLQKYAYGLPLYRQEEMCAQMGVEIPRCTMARWVVEAAEQCRPVWNILQDRLMKSDYVGCDETRIQVLNEKGRVAESQSWMWVRATPFGDKRIILFEYDPHRSGAVVKRLFGDFRGTLQVDGYSAYDGVVQNHGLTGLGCAMHARRKFEKALVSGAPKGKALAEVGMQFFKNLYAIETEARSLAPEERHQLRLEKAVPLWAEFKQWSIDVKAKVPPKSKMGEALKYFQSEYEFLVGYLQDGRFEIDNGFAERAITSFAIGRKNWLFSSSEDGARASELFYSFVVTAKINGVDPGAAIREIFELVPRAKTIDDFEKIADILLTPKTIQ